MRKKYLRYLIFSLAMFIVTLSHGQADCPGEQFDKAVANEQNTRSAIIDVEFIDQIKPFISDPFRDYIKVYVYTDQAIWGTQSPYTSGVVDFSINNTYLWDSARVEDFDDELNPLRYTCGSYWPFYLDKAINKIYFHASYEEKGDRSDEIFDLTMKYNKPVVFIDSVNNYPYIGKTIVVNSDHEVNFKVRLERTYDTVVDAFDRINGLEISHMESGAPPALIPYPDILNTTEWINVSVVSLLKPGYNTFHFRARGKCAGNCEEYSEIVELTIFYLDFEDISSTVCRYDSVVELTGIPKGGYFTGGGIVDEPSTIFNPLIANPGPNEVIYHYWVEGEEYTVPKQFLVNSLPEIDLIGEREVCSNDHNIIYTINNQVQGDYNYTWEISGGEPSYFSGPDKLLPINWLNEKTGIINLTATNKETNCSSSFKYIIDIDSTPAPPPAIMFVYNDNLLVCSDTKANYFVWHSQDRLLNNDTTNVPYYFNENLNPMQNEVFYVETAYIMNKHSCFTKSEDFIYDKGKALSASSYLNYKTDFEIYPNPNQGEFLINFKTCKPGFATMNILDCNGRIMLKDESYIFPGLVRQIKIRQLISGIYIIQTISDQGTHYNKFIVY